MTLDVVGHRTIATLNPSKPTATHTERSRGFDVMVSTILLALLVAAIAQVRIAKAISHLQSILS